MTAKCCVPYCDQDGITRLGYCVAHAKLPHHVGQTVHYRVNPSVSRESVSRVVAEVDLARGMFRFEGDQGWHYPGDLCTQSAPTPQEWIAIEETPEWKSGNRRLSPRRYR